MAQLSPLVVQPVRLPRVRLPQESIRRRDPLAEAQLAVVVAVEAVLVVVVSSELDWMIEFVRIFSF